MIGAFQLTIPVSEKSLLLPREQLQLSVLRWIGEAIQPTNRWYPVFHRYLQGIAGRVEGHDSHDAPQVNCTCGIYAAKTLHHFGAGYEQYGIHGEVYLWGTVVEHERGWRAQLAYPKNLFLSPDALPFTLAEIWPRLQALTLYGSDIFVLDNDHTSSLWGKRSGFDPAGLDYLIERSNGYYDRRQRDRTLKKGDRVAILGRGIAVVEHVDCKWIQAVVWNKCGLRIARKEIVWDERNMRWETDGFPASLD